MLGQPRNEIALRCTNVGKIYDIDRTKGVLRLLFGLKANSNSLIYALRDISLAVPRGKIVGILGRNGAGKSTLLRLLGQVYTPTQGHIEVFGQIAGLFELGGMGNPNLTGREYAVRYLQFMGVSGKDINNILDDIADFSELGEAFDQKIRTYSSGMGARLYFAVATAYQYEIYLIDELLSVGDEHFQAKCWQRLRERLLNGASGVLVTHDWTAIIKLCEQACVIEDGRFSFSGSSDQAVVSYLKLPIPSALMARFADSMPNEFVVRSTKDLQIRIPVEILNDIEVELSISIEMLRIGIGWEIIILSEHLMVGDTMGNYEVDLQIPALPLKPGRYSLNLFLSQRATRSSLDCRSWTYGNGLSLIVAGDDSVFSAELALSCVTKPLQRFEA